MSDYSTICDAQEAFQSIVPEANPEPEYFSVLNEEQKAAVTHEGSPLLILAGAGSGKTRVITTKIAYLIDRRGVRPESILAVTFTKKAANEMQERAIRLSPEASRAQIRTFHSFGAWFLRMHHEEAGIDANFTVYDDDDMTTLVTKAVPSLTRQQAALMAHKISLAKDYCYLPDDPALAQIDNRPEFPQIYAAYQERLRQTGNVDFGDLIMLPVLVLRQSEAVRRHVQYRFRVIMVDEYQDTNVAQYLLLQQLCGIHEGSGTYVCVVGDDDQSIYKFRGAKIENILTFGQKFPGTQTIRLETNYRSRPEILSQANSVIGNNGGRLGKTLRAERAGGRTRPALVFLPNQDDETAFVAEMVLKSHARGCPFSDWAVLYRTNAQSMGFETEFMRRKIPYAIVGALKFYEREEVKDILACLSLCANPKGEVAFRRIVNKPARGIGNSTQDRIIDAARQEGASLLEAAADAQKFGAPKKAACALSEFAAMMGEFKKFLSRPENEGAPLPAEKMASDALGGSAQAQGEGIQRLSEFLEFVAQRSGLKEYHEQQDEISGTQRAANIQELANSAALYPCSEAGLLDFLDHIALDRTLESPDDDAAADKVTLITLHNTKGLEFPRVVITGMENGIFPRTDKNEEEIEEERRLMYVGITRARDELYLTSCKLRRMYGKTSYMEPSVFLMEMDAAQMQVMGSVPYSFTRPQRERSPLESKWRRGTRIYHDDYGYGVVSSSKTDSDSGEFVITARFDSGATKQFLPKYQGNRLEVIGEGGE